MVKRNRILFIIALILVAVVVAAGAFMASTPKEETKVLRIGVLPVIDTLPLHVAEEEGLFDQEGIDVQLVEFNSALERDAAFTAGSIQGYFGDLVNTLVLRKTMDVRVVTVDYRTLADNRMFAILASPNSGISDITQLNGTSIATSVASISEYFMTEMLTANGITDEVLVQQVPAIPIRYSSLLSDQISVAVLPEPFVTRAISDGAILLTDDRAVNTTATVIALRGDWISENQQAAKSFLKAYNASVAKVNEDPWRYSQVLYDKLHFPEELRNTFAFPPLSPVTLPAGEDLERVQDWMMDIGILTERFSFNDVMATGLHG
ncbi:MAG: ABC transporter substrate-binding protein [Methanomassiliicoccus sp.]|nr:ABC transporter substrate-binding protein [Methanomassiliicoccus sp.]